MVQAIRRYGHVSTLRSDTQELFIRMVFNIFVSFETYGVTGKLIGQGALVIRELDNVGSRALISEIRRL